MKSKKTEKFDKLLRALPQDVQRQAIAAYRQFKRDPYHPSLHFKRVSRRTPTYSARVGDDYHALGRREEDDLIVWFWIGTHDEYMRLLK
jgi:hypothetical protein